MCGLISKPRLGQEHVPAQVFGVLLWRRTPEFAVVPRGPGPIRYACRSKIAVLVLDGGDSLHGCPGVQINQSATTHCHLRGVAGLGGTDGFGGLSGLAGLAVVGLGGGPTKGLTGTRGLTVRLPDGFTLA